VLQAGPSSVINETVGMGIGEALHVKLVTAMEGAPHPHVLTHACHAATLVSAHAGRASHITNRAHGVG
jgi:hypothetical protein